MRITIGAVSASRILIVALIVLFGIVPLSGCYTYAAPRPGISYETHPVQVTLTDSGSVILASQIGPSMVFVDGTFVRDSVDGYVISVRSTERRDGSVVEWKGERVTIPHILVASLGTRQFSATKSTLVVALGIAAIVVVTAAFGGLGNGFGSGHGGHVPPGAQ